MHALYIYVAAVCAASSNSIYICIYILYLDVLATMKSYILPGITLVVEGKLVRGIRQINTIEHANQVQVDSRQYQVYSRQ